MLQGSCQTIRNGQIPCVPGGINVNGLKKYLKPSMLLSPGAEKNGDNKMKLKLGMRVLSLLLVFALIGAMFVPAVSAESASTYSKMDQSNGETLQVTLTLNDDGTIAITDGPVKGSIITTLKAVEIPEGWKNRDFNEEKLIPTDRDWEFLNSSLKSLPEKERNYLIIEVKKIYSGTSELSIEEQTKVLEQVGHYLITATEGSDPSIKWNGVNGHWQMSTTAGNLLHYITATHVNTLGDYSYWADESENRDEPPIGVIANRHSWVIGEPGVPGCDNYGPDSCEYYMDLARSNFDQYDTNAAYVNVSKGLHFIEDLSCPFHTSAVTGQLHHIGYESWASSNWSLLESAMQVDSYYIINDPSEDSKYLAQFSHQYLQEICNIMNTPGWESSQQLVDLLADYSRAMIRESEMMTMGMLVYSTKFESPDTLGGNGVPIFDNSTSYAYINNIACSDNLYQTFQITHTNIGDLEIWLGLKTDSSPTYSEAKVWDRQGEGTENLALTIGIQNFQDIHDWRLRVKDNAGGDEGSIETFYSLIG